jgi:hypothetical protein
MFTGYMTDDTKAKPEAAFEASRFSAYSTYGQ